MPPVFVVVVVLVAASMDVTEYIRDSNFDGDNDRHLGSDTVDRHRNLHLVGKRHELTNVPFDADGFPVFDSKANVEIPKELNSPDVSDCRQFKHATGALLDFLIQNPREQTAFTPEQLGDIFAGKARITGLTWHRHQDGRTLQLVDRLLHRLTGHCGGRALNAAANPNASSEKER